MAFAIADISTVGEVIVNNSSGTCTLNNVTAGDYIVVVGDTLSRATGASITFASFTATGLTFALGSRSQTNYNIGPPFNFQCYWGIEFWAAPVSSNLGSVTITGNISAAGADNSANFVAFRVTGSVAQAFDTNGSLPATNVGPTCSTGVSSTQQVTGVSTNANNTVLIAACCWTGTGSGNASGFNFNGWTQIVRNQNSSSGGSRNVLDVQAKVVTPNQNNATIQFATSAGGSSVSSDSCWFIAAHAVDGPIPAVRLTQQNLEVLSTGGANKARLTQQSVEVLHTGGANKARLTQQNLEVLSTGGANKARLTQQYLEVLYLPGTTIIPPPQPDVLGFVDERW